MNEIPQAKEQTTAGRLLERTSLSLDDQAPAPVQPAGDMSAIDDLSGGLEEPSSEPQPEPAPFTSENLAIFQGESANDTSATDNASGDQSDVVVRPLPEPAPLRPDDQSDFNVEDHRFDPASGESSRGTVESSRDTSVTDDASLDEADSAVAILVPLAAPFFFFFFFFSCTRSKPGPRSRGGSARGRDYRHHRWPRPPGGKHTDVETH